MQATQGSALAYNQERGVKMVVGKKWFIAVNCSFTEFKSATHTQPE